MKRYAVYVQRVFVRFCGEVQAESPTEAKVAAARIKRDFRPCPDCAEKDLGEEIHIDLILEEILTQTDDKGAEQ